MGARRTGPEAGVFVAAPARSRACRRQAPRVPPVPTSTPVPPAPPPAAARRGARPCAGFGRAPPGTAPAPAAGRPAGRSRSPRGARRAAPRRRPAAHGPAPAAAGPRRASRSSWPRGRQSAIRPEEVARRTDAARSPGRGRLAAGPSPRGWPTWYVPHQSPRSSAIATLALRIRSDLRRRWRAGRGRASGDERQRGRGARRRDAGRPSDDLARRTPQDELPGASSWAASQGPGVGCWFGGACCGRQDRSLPGGTSRMGPLALQGYTPIVIATAV